MRNLLHLLLIAASACLGGAETKADGPIRFDLSAQTGRGDAKTPGWDTWELGEAAEATQVDRDVEVTLRATAGKLNGFLQKKGLATGASLSSDGVACSEPLEIVINGLSPGRHTLVTYHNRVSEPDGPELKLTTGESQSICKPSRSTPDDADAASNYVEFYVADGAPLTARLEAVGEPSDGGVVLNAIEIDGADPQRRADKPYPHDLDEHANGNNNSLELKWRAPASGKMFRVYLAHGRDRNSVVAEARSATDDSPCYLGETDQPRRTVEVDPADSLQHYCWRVDSIDADGKVTRGDVWTFRVRHLAFPSAEGYGRFALGGRGGVVLKVTNLNDSGPGSLRAALEASGPRTIVFDVSGRIVLKSRLIVRNDYVTIAGQTAPGNGICISNYNLGLLGARDAVVRFVRVRPGDTSGDTLDGMGLASCDHSIIDHCSISWTQDESFSSRGAKNITLQRTLISEALNIAGHRKYEVGKSHGFAASIGGDIGSFHHNLLAHCAGRNWSLAGSVDQANIHAGRLDIRNNVVYNWGYRTTDGGAKQVQFVNNYYKPGPATTVFHLLKPERNHAFGPQDYYVSGNVMEGRYDGLDPWAGVIQPEGEPLSEFVYDQPFWKSHVNTQTAEQAYRDVLADVGCNVPMLDDHDQRVIRETRTTTATHKGSRGGLPGLPDSQEDVGGWDDYPEVHRPDGWDSDGDGMPDAWEVQNGFDGGSPSDGPQDADGNGYTNLEEYLNGLVDRQGRPE